MAPPRAVLAAVALLGTLLLAPAVANAQCSMCRTAIESSEEGRAMAEKLNRGIVVLLGAPVAVVAAIGFAIVCGRRKRGSSVGKP